MSWWLIAVTLLAGVLFGAGVACIVVLAYLARGFRW